MLLPWIIHLIKNKNVEYKFVYCNKTRSTGNGGSWGCTPFGSSKQIIMISVSRKHLACVSDEKRQRCLGHKFFLNKMVSIKRKIK